MISERKLTRARREQGFKSQAHLDAFYRYYDHTQACAECQKDAPGALLDDGYQPAQNRCERAIELQRTVDAIAFRAVEQPPSPPITLASGRVLNHRRMSDGVQEVIEDLSHDEWEEYCAILTGKNKEFATKRHAQTRSCGDCAAA